MQIKKHDVYLWLVIRRTLHCIYCKQQARVFVFETIKAQNKCNFHWHDITVTVLHILIKVVALQYQTSIGIMRKWQLKNCHRPVSVLPKSGKIERRPPGWSCNRVATAENFAHRRAPIEVKWTVTGRFFSVSRRSKTDRAGIFQSPDSAWTAFDWIGLRPNDYFYFKSHPTHRRAYWHLIGTAICKVIIYWWYCPKWKMGKSLLEIQQTLC